MLQIRFQHEKELDLITKQLLKKHSFNKLIKIAEDCICQTMGNTKCYILWNCNSVERDWKKGYYNFVFDNQDIVDRKSAKWISVYNEYGQIEPCYHYPIKEVEDWYGSILIFFKRKRSITSWHESILEHTSRLLVYQYQQVKENKVTEEKIKQILQKKVARDMHDGVAQKLFFLSAQLYSITKELSPRTSDEERKRLEKLAESVQDSLNHVRNYMHHLYDCEWEGDLYQRLKKSLEEKSVAANLEVDLKLNGFTSNEAPEILQTIYRIIDEATTNVVKHAKATRIEVYVESTPIQWCIKVIDNGIGMKKTTKSNGRLGLIGMEERVKQVGGFLSLRSDESGTDITAIIPRGFGRKRGE